MQVKRIIPILNVSNIVESFAWFEKLGWKKGWDWGDPPTFGGVFSLHCEIFLCQDGQGSRGGPIRGPQAGSPLGVGVPRHVGDDDTGGVWMSWFLSAPAEVDATYKLALEQGITVTRPPTDEPWGVRECHLRHPDGHTFRVSAGIGGEKEEGNA